MLHRNWWMLLLKGILLVVFGILAFSRPGITMTTLVIWFAAYLIVDGILSLTGVFSNWKEKEDKWLVVIEGAIGIFLGWMIYRHPLKFELFIAFLIGFWFIFTGISKIAMAIQLRKEMEGEGWLALSGLLSILFGILIYALPGTAITGLIWMIAIFAVSIGILLMILSLKLRKSGKAIAEKLSEVRSKIADIRDGRKN